MFNRLIASLLPLMPKKLVWLFSKSYIAGEDIDSAIKISKNLNDKNIKITIDVLGEFIEHLDQARENKNEYLDVIEKVQKNKIDGNYSLKPTSFGLLIDKDVCYQYVEEVVRKAASYNNFVRIDMEDSPCVDLEIELYRKLHADYPKNVGLVFQSYMKRTMNDLKNLMDIHSEETPLNYRLCKGIYVEPAEIAYKDHDEVNSHYLKNLEFLFQNNIYPGIATHDKFLIQESLKLIEKYNVPKDRYEFQMLYGVTPELRKSIVAEGHTMRVYVPFGKDWFGYSTRRLKENPKMASYIIKALFKKG